MHWACTRSEFLYSCSVSQQSAVCLPHWPYCNERTKQQIWLSIYAKRAKIINARLPKHLMTCKELQRQKWHKWHLIGLDQINWRSDQSSAKVATVLQVATPQGCEKSKRSYEERYIQSRAEVRAIFLNVDKPLAEKSPRPGHSRVTAIHQNTRGLPSFEGYKVPL